MNGAELIAAERKRQQSVENYGARHDDRHKSGQLALAACAYALPNDPTHIDIPRKAFMPTGWRFKPGDRIRELSKAGALIAAEIDRLQRVPHSKGPK